MSQKSVSLLLVGRDGNGKSSTGNSILGDKKHFNPTSSSSSAGLEIKQSSATVADDRKVTVTEIAGLEYPGSDYTGNFEDTLNKIGETIENNEQGFNAIIFVLKYGTRFTKQEKDALLMIKSIFGFNVLKEFGVIVMTCGDSFELDVEEEKQTFEEWCQAQTGDVKILFEDCDYRCVLFNNRTKDADKMKEQWNKLFSLVNPEKIRHSYTQNEYKAAIKGQTEFLVQTKLPQLEKEKNETMGEIWKDLAKIDEKLLTPCNIVELSTALNNVENKLLHLKESLQDKDKQTGVLKHLFYDISIAEMKLGIAKQRFQVVISSGAWDIVFVNGSFNVKNITETVSIRKCSLDGDGQFSSSSVSRCGIDLLEICKTTPVCQDHDTNFKDEEKFAQVHGHSTQAEVTQAQDDGIQAEVTQAQDDGIQAEVTHAQDHGTPAEVTHAQDHGTPAEVTHAQDNGTPAEVTHAQDNGTQAEVTHTQGHGTQAEVTHAQGHGTQAEVTQAQDHITQTEVTLAQGHSTQKQETQAQGHGTQFRDNPHTSAVVDHTVHNKPDSDLENTKITFETISTILKQYNYTNALCLISKYKQILTKQEIEAVIKMIKAICDTNRVKNQSILILTCDNDNLEVESDQMIKVWCQEITGSNKQLLDLCGERCVLLNPCTKVKGELQSQTKRLQESVAGLNTRNASKALRATKSANPEPETKGQKQGFSSMVSAWASSKVSSWVSSFKNLNASKS